jgi:hypothetical protein
MQAIALRTGTIVAWISGFDLFALDGRAVGFVRGRGVFSRAGELQGYYQNSAFRDLTGKLVAILDDGPARQVPPVLQPAIPGSVLTDWPPQVPSLDQWSPHWRGVFGAYVADTVDAAQTATAL